MNNQDSKTITISKEFVRKMGGVVILPSRKYNELYEKALIKNGLKKKDQKKKT